MTEAILSVYLALLQLSLTSLSMQLDAMPVSPVYEPAAQSIDAPEWIKSRIAHYAERYGVSEFTMTKVIKCESEFDPNAEGDFSTTTGSYRSFGLAQINLPSHPNITISEAKNPEFALNFLASNLSLGNGRLWTCYKKLVD